MLTLFKSKKFQEEYNTYKTVIEQIDNEKIKADLETLLSKLILEVRAVDQQHQELLATRKMPALTDDSKTRILEIRKQLDRRVRDWKESQKS